MPTDSENVCLWGKTGRERHTVKTALLTQLGHWAAASRVDCLPFLTRRTPQSARLRTSGRLSFRGTNETARVHDRVRRRYDSVAACGSRAAEVDAGDRLPWHRAQFARPGRVQPRSA